MVLIPQARSLFMLLSALSLLHQPASADIRDTFWVALVRGWNTQWECGIQREASLNRPRPSSGKILGGEDVTQEGRWPWMAYIYYSQKGRVDGFFCGGTLIDTEWIMTAAHCIKTPNEPLQYRVILGERDIGDISGNERDYEVSKIVMHPDFKETTYENDIALIKLSTPVFFSPYVRPPCLPPSGFETDAVRGATLAGTECAVLGWGRTDTKIQSDVLQVANVTLQPRSLCNSLTQNEAYLSPVTYSSPQFCATGRDGIDTCFGDSGGPLLCKQENKYYLHGVTSYGPSTGCGSDTPTIYGQASRFREWMSLNIVQG